ncbi:inositol monophosphatase family protein [Pseudonocardia kunmingensis]|uniref:Inositol-1-monophosphatase n=1 Tax=Pseudonocardia kunmingensis TaxID=630975 RepID=A0A543DW98_9PSEU|nr:inositol monophosphatase family protein [Pseudonocardia kunmingensis]TQM13602.1 myo-inositol-1(or 4)-monophosphatase [Pseudonocardia kunmingensis]
MVTVNDASPTAPTAADPPTSSVAGGDGTEPADLRRIAESLVREAAEHLSGLPRPWDERGGAAPDGVATKSTPTDVVTASDHALEALIRERLAELRPDDAVVGEEHGSTAGESRTVWVVDPIDGTVNFLYGMPWYAISVAAVRDGASVAGAVYEPAAGRLWSAAVGAGATCDGRPLRVSGATDLSLSLLGTGFSYRAERRVRQVRMVSGMLPHVRDVRRAGAASLDLCAVAAGWVDAYLEHGTNWWDWAAAALIAQEAGALVRTPGPTGSVPPDDGLGGDALLAATPAIAEELAALARAHGAAEV